MDESSLELNPRKRRFFGRRRISATLEKRKITIFGFMALNGKSVLMLSEKSRKEDFMAFLRLMRRKNPDKRLVPLLDNARIHWAKDSRKEADELNIRMVFLPPYSPDLNPIEFCWKDLKRHLAKLLSFDEVVTEASRIANELMLEKRFSYARYWLKSFGAVIGFS